MYTFVYSLNITCSYRFFYLGQQLKDQILSRTVTCKFGPEEAPSSSLTLVTELVGVVIIG